MRSPNHQERQRKKRGREEQRNRGRTQQCSYSPSLPREVLYVIFDFCDVDTIAKSAALVEKQWKDEALSVQRWVQLCHMLWKEKAYVPRCFLGDPSIKSYFLSIKDSKRSRFLSTEELCLQHFHFRFRRAAGEYWCDRDPALLPPSAISNCIPMYRRFTAAGLLSHLPPARPPIRSMREAREMERGHHIDRFALAPDFDPLESDPEIQSFIPIIRWRWTKTRNGRRGQFIKLNSWPSYTVRRNSIEMNGGCLPGCQSGTTEVDQNCGCDDWGWTLSSEWVKMRTCCASTVERRPVWLTDDDEDEREVL